MAGSGDGIRNRTEVSLGALRKAAALLQQGATVSEAAEKVGFDGLSYFARCFKDQFSISPSAYLLAHKGA
ncbi:helix-turn-helix domain-containing protein [Fibrisoma montanum]|uniref:helix-turn-helix domain-containing protein n=1 Tax=Fibrisoma montanum TaxID=2305895 RepID=UPI00131493EE|nr:helix-turn-helix domain-containing protein [Fibrisoma montanum]